MTIAGLIGNETIGFTASTTGTDAAATVGAFTLGNGTTTVTFTGTDAGSYEMTVSATLANGTGTASNYTFAGTSASWTVEQRVIALSWRYYENSTDTAAYVFGSNLTFVNGTTYLKVVPTITNVVSGESLNLTQYFFGFCTCEGAEPDHDHNHGVSTTGVNHAGQYWTYLAVSAGAGTTLANYTFVGATGNTGITGYTLTSGDVLQGTTHQTNTYAEIDLSSISTDGDINGLADGTAFLGAFYVDRATLGFTPDNNSSGYMTYNGHSLTSEEGMDITLSGGVSEAQVSVKIYRSLDDGANYTQIYSDTLANYRANFRDNVSNATKNRGLYRIDFEQENQAGTTTCDTVQGTVTGMRYTYEVYQRELNVDSWDYTTVGGNTYTYVYDKSGSMPTASIAGVSGDKGLISGDVVSFLYNLAAADVTNVGTYSVVVNGLTGADADNYVLDDEGSFTSHAWIVTQKTVGLTWTDPSVTYDGQSHGPAVATLTGIVEGDVCTITYSGTTTAETNANNYTTTAASLSNANYALPASASKAWTIATKTLTATWSEGNSFTYNGTAQGRTLTIDGIVGTETISFTYTVTGLDTPVAFYLGNGTVTHDFTATDVRIVSGAVASYSVDSVTINGNGANGGLAANYTLASTSASWTIGKKAVTLDYRKAYYLSSENEVVTSFSWTNYYGTTADAAPASYVYAGSNVWQGLLLDFGGFVGSETLTYTLTLTGGNYTKYNVGSVATRYTSASSTSNTSFGTNVKLLIANNLADETAISIGGTFTNGSNGGKVTNYDLSGLTLTNNIAIARKTLSAYDWSMTDGDTTITSGFSATYNGSAWTLTATTATAKAYGTVTYNDGYMLAADMIAGWTTSLSIDGTHNSALLSDNVQTNVGNYTANIAAGNADETDSRYVFAAGSQAYTIAPREITIDTVTWTTADVVYNATEQNGATLTLSNIVSGDTVLPQFITFTATSGSLTNGKPVNVGTYTTTVTITGSSAGNYALVGSTTSGEWHITAKNVTVTWSDAAGFTGIYKAAAQGVSASLDKTATAGTEAPIKASIANANEIFMA